MMNSTPIIKSFAPPPVKKREIYRYMKCKEGDGETEALVNQALSLVEGELRYDTVSLKLDIISISDGVIDFGNTKVKSYDLAKNLCDCDGAVIFAATLGISLDRLIAKHGRISPATALALQAVGSERIEALCDALCDDIKDQYGHIRPRFSAGYGDLPLEFQKDIFSLLSCSKCIGLTLNESLLMSPIKSVTAIIGIKKTDQNHEIT